ncbi:Fasciclin-domain-containing protein [Phellopilus nigrolimitatus]|nr:Fasciclin-domain-containing protein [Phellopilus nigrolimitatus]
MNFTLLAGILMLAATVTAQNATFLAQFLQELQNLGLTSLANVSSHINSTSTGQSLLSTLGTGPQTIFAPNNNAWAGAYSNVTSSSELLAEVLSYHVVPGTFNVTPTYPNTSVGRTLLNASDLVFLEGNKRQVLAWANESDGRISILNQNTPVTVVNSTTFGNLTVHVTDAVIDVPGEFTAALAANNLTAFTAALQTASLLNPLNTIHGVTIFAPNDAAFAAVQNLTAAGSNATVLANILKNHVINGTSVYSGNLLALGSGSNETTAAGEGLGASFNSSGGYVKGGNATAKIVTPDIILWNGVVHIIDTVLFNEASDASAASSAVSSASRVATSSATESGPVGFTPSATSASGSSSSSSAANAMSDLLYTPLTHVGIAGAVSVLAATFGGLLVL